MQEFQTNVFGLPMAYGVNLGVTMGLGKENQWAWRIPIIVMQIFPILLMSFIAQLPETPQWFMSKEQREDAREASEHIYGKEEAESNLEALQKAQDEESDEKVGYQDMLLPSGSQIHPTMITVMGQVNQALTGYGAVSVYCPQSLSFLDSASGKQST